MYQVTAEDVADVINIQRVQTSYADIVTRRSWGELATIFAPDAEIRIDKREGEPLVLRGPEALGEFIGTSLEAFEFFEFVILNAVVDAEEVAQGRAGGRMYIAELRQDALSGRRTTAFGLYRDRFAKVEGAWRFAGRHYRSAARSQPKELDYFGFGEG